MILQALKSYYDRKAADPDSDIAPSGWEKKEIRFVVTLDTEGNPVLLEDTEFIVNKKKRSKTFMVPQGVKRSNNIAANLLWDNPEYALGVTLKGKPERVEKQFADFKQNINHLPPDDAGAKAVRAFLAKENPAALLERFGEVWKAVLDSGGNIAFRLQGDSELISSRPAIRNYVDETAKREGNVICLLTGHKDALAETHPAIEGVWGAQSSGANIVSFNAKAFESFGQSQGANAPIGETAAFAYTTALNVLLHKDSPQRMQVGEASTVFWSEKATNMESQFAAFFKEPEKDNPDALTEAVKALFSAPQSGSLPGPDEDKTKFYVLGLSPNASRIAIRFWIAAPLADMEEKIRQHFRDLEIVHGPKEQPYFSLFRLLRSTAPLDKAENIPPNLEGDLMRTILEGLPYPSSLLHAVLRRIKVEHEIPMIRAALVKACLNRNNRFENNNRTKELTMSLDLENNNIGYRLGRLFAVLEKIQEEANPGLNATIRDRYYAAASSSPSSVFSRLMTLKNHHLSKLENAGRRENFERLIAEIVAEINDFPPFLPLDDQGRFAVGYYHQRQAFFTKKEQNN